MHGQTDDEKTKLPPHIVGKGIRMEATVIVMIV